MKKYTILKYAMLMIVLMQMLGCKQGGDSCDDSNRKPDEYRNLSEDDKNKIPYGTGYDSLVYISNMQDTAILYGKGRREYYEKDYVEGPCVGYGYYICAQNIYYNFVGNNPELNRLEVNYYYDLSLENPMKFIRWTLKNGNVSNRLSFMNDSNNYSSSILYKGKTVYGINGDDYFYTYRYGFISIKFMNGKTWILTN
jgi:hypothetical protein